MRILIMSTYDVDGGASAAAFRLMKGLQKYSPQDEVGMLVAGKRSDHPDVVALPSASPLQGKVMMHLEFTPARFYRKRDMNSLFTSGLVSSPNVLSAIKKFQPDVVHLHWISLGFISVKDLAKIEVPVVWTMHDMWAFTGGCHYDQYCGRYTSGCGQCPNLNSGRRHDLSEYNFRNKQKAYAQMKGLTLVGPSQWITQEAQRSRLAEHYRAANLPNPIDTELFFPEDVIQARQKLGLPTNRKLVLFGAMSATSNPRKGFDLALDALTHLSTLPGGDQVDLVIMGDEPPADKPDFPFPTHYTGWIKDPTVMRSLYSAADVFLSPSRQENLSNMIVEAMACGTPVACFDIGGNRDMVLQEETGVLAEAGDTHGLAERLHWVINHASPDTLSRQARQRAESHFAEQVVIPRFLDLYRQTIQQPTNLSQYTS